MGNAAAEHEIFMLLMNNVREVEIFFKDFWTGNAKNAK